MVSHEGEKKGSTEHYPGGNKLINSPEKMTPEEMNDIGHILKRKKM